MADTISFSKNQSGNEAGEFNSKKNRTQELANPFQVEENKPKLEKFVFWHKFYAILLYINGGLQISSILGIPIGVILIIGGNKVNKMAENITKMQLAKTPEERVQLAFESTEAISKYYKYYSIGILVMLGVILLLTIIAFLFLIFVFGTTQATN